MFDFPIIVSTFCVNLAVSYCSTGALSEAALNALIAVCKRIKYYPAVGKRKKLQRMIA